MNSRATLSSPINSPEFFSVEHFREFDNFINEMRDDLIPYIGKNFPVLDGRDNRAVAGLSMGGRSALYLGIAMSDYFAYVGAFTPAIGVLPYPREKSLFTKETLTLPREYTKSTLVIITKGTKDGVLGNNPIDYSNALKDNRIEHLYYEAEGGHDFGVWKKISPAISFSKNGG